MVAIPVELSRYTARGSVIIEFTIRVGDAETAAKEVIVDTMGIAETPLKVRSLQNVTKDTAHCIHETEDWKQPTEDCDSVNGPSSLLGSKGSSRPFVHVTDDVVEDSMIGDRDTFRFIKLLERFYTDNLLANKNMPALESIHAIRLMAGGRASKLISNIATRAVAARDNILPGNNGLFGGSQISRVDPDDLDKRLGEKQEAASEVSQKLDTLLTFKNIEGAASDVSSIVIPKTSVDDSLSALATQRDNAIRGIRYLDNALNLTINDIEISIERAEAATEKTLTRRRIFGLLAAGSGVGIADFNKAPFGQVGQLLPIAQ